MSDRYLLGEDGKTPVPAGDLLTWARAAEKADRKQDGPAPGAGWARVAYTKLAEGAYVSTVFLGLNHRWPSDGPGAPLVFETMVFGLTGDDEWQERCSTWEEAEALHLKGVAYAETVLAAGFADVEPRS